MPHNHTDLLRLARTGQIAVGANEAVTVGPKADAGVAARLRVVLAAQEVVHLEENNGLPVLRPIKKPSDRVDDIDLGIALETLRQAEAEGQIHRVWMNAGGPRSSVGLPIDGVVRARPMADGNYSAQFRSGTISQDRDKAEFVTHTFSQAVVEFVGLECRIRQEKTDEVYGVVGCLGPANGSGTTFTLGLHKMGAEGERVWIPPQAVLYVGPVQDLFLVGTLVENDSGDADDISRKVAETIIEVGGPLLQGATGIAAESVSSETWFQDGLGAVVGLVLDGAFGIGDDPYGEQSLRVSWQDINSWPPFRTTIRDDDPRPIANWTHELVLTGTDHGGDRGAYALYFRVRRQDVSTTERVPLP